MATPSVVISVFVDWKVSVMSFGVGAGVYSIGPRGSVVAGDHARSNCELRVTSRSSEEGYGNDADRIEFQIRDANNQIDLKCGQTSALQGRSTRAKVQGEAQSSQGWRISQVGHSAQGHRGPMRQLRSDRE